MRSLIWKELRENIKWVPLPGLVILLVFLIQRPTEPMPDLMGTFFFCLTGVAFGAALGFLQIFSEGHGDKRSLLLHRPLSQSRIFLVKAVVGVGIYLLALGIPFVCLESWYATPGKMPAPYHWRTSLPWLADIFSGLVYYFVGMLIAQRDVRWYGSRGLALATAFFCSYLVWTLPEFWQALAAIGIIGSFVAVAAWGSFRAGGVYAGQPRLAKAGLGLTFLAGLLTVSVLGKQMIGEWSDSEFEWNYAVDRQGRVIVYPMALTFGPIGPWTDLSGQELPEYKGKEDYAIQAPGGGMETPLDWSYRNSGRFYVECRNDSTPGDEIWFFDRTLRRLVGYDYMLHQFLGSIGPDGFTPPGDQPGQGFPGELRYRTTRWRAGRMECLAFSDGVYSVDYTRRAIRTIFTPPAGETVTFGRECGDALNRKWERVLVSTDKSLHFLTEEGAAVVSFPRAHDGRKDGYLVFLGKLEKPERYFAYYRSWGFLAEPEEHKTSLFHLHEYDAAGRELARRSDPQLPYPAPSYAKALFGLVTPMTEATTMVGTSQYLRSEARLQGGTRQPVLLTYLENIRYYIPGTSRNEGTTRGLIPAYIALILLSAGAGSFACFLLARRYAFSCARCIGWALVGFFFGWVGLLLMLALQEWPARISCPKCRKRRVVTRDRCEHCGAPHALPERDGTEIIEASSTSSCAVFIGR